jgi:pyroglutamyl-peptidase
MKILLTGFEPFLNHKSNPTIDLVYDLELSIDEDIKTLILPVAYSDVQKIIETELNHNTYDLICSLGLATDRKDANHEIFAQNYIYSNGPDNNNVLIKHKAISKNHPISFKTTWSINDDIITPSFHAGNYLCNYVYYNFLRDTKKDTSVAFIHIPMVKKNDSKYKEIKQQILHFINNEIEVKKHEKK